MIHPNPSCCFNIVSRRDGQFSFPYGLKGSWKSFKVSREVSNPVSPQRMITLPNCNLDFLHCHVGMLSAVWFPQNQLTLCASGVLQPKL